MWLGVDARNRLCCYPRRWKSVACLPLGVVRDCGNPHEAVPETFSRIIAEIGRELPSIVGGVGLPIMNAGGVARNRSSTNVMWRFLSRFAKGVHAHQDTRTGLAEVDDSGRGLGLASAALTLWGSQLPTAGKFDSATRPPPSLISWNP